MCWRKTFALLKLCNTPASICSPFPLFAISLFLISGRGLSLYGLPLLFAGIIVSYLLTYPSNLWNHCNDLKEDTAAEKKTILIDDPSMQKKAIHISVLLYVCSLLFVYYLSIEFKRPIYFYTIIWIIVTWLYSDNLILKKLIGFRSKQHYIGELITYSIASPVYVLSVWLVYSDLNSKAIVITIAVFLFSISGLLLKDIKDISGDKKAGLKTFGVVFPAPQLLKYSCYLMILFYFAFLNPFTLKIFGPGILIIIIPFAYFFKNTFIHMYRKDWTLDRGDFQALKSMGISIYASFIFIGLSVFI
jgi:1,4-dihydroxy-2-naphthoate octaprenyltransferase